MLGRLALCRLLIFELVAVTLAFSLCLLILHRNILGQTAKIICLVLENKHCSVLIWCNMEISMGIHFRGRRKKHVNDVGLVLYLS